MAISQQSALKTVAVLSLALAAAGGGWRSVTPLAQAAEMEPPQAGRAHHDMQDCPKGAVSLPDTLKGWAEPAPLTAAATLKELDGAKLIIGKAVVAHLRSTAEMQYVARPEEPGGKVSSGGMFAFDVPAAGTYRVMLGHRAWLDVAQDGKTVLSSDHHRGPACSGIGKMVDFPLAAGRAVVEVSGSGKPDMTVMVIRVS